MRRKLGKCKGGKVLIKRTTKGGKQVITTCVIPNISLSLDLSYAQYKVYFGFPANICSTIGLW